MDIGKEHHHAVVIDADGRRLLSRRVRNDESALLELIGQVADLAEVTDWAVDLLTAELAIRCCSRASAAASCCCSA
ncbi:IS110 family transposase [Nocardia vinacea]|uniref:IS110 family transposase n=1 Tax=Nocardia vinacea TaxID=96468 RepID=UPI003AF35091